VDVMIPILNPAGVQEILDYGLYGYAMNPLLRRLGGVQVREENIDPRLRGRLPRPREDHHARRLRHAAGGLNIRNRDGVLDQEARSRTSSATPCWPSCGRTG
jgi:indolepyruvate ferredoxin oxidoreductase